LSIQVENIDINWNEKMPVFASPEYLKSLSEDFGWLGGFLGDNAEFVLPYVVRRKKAFRYVQFVTEVLVLNDKADKVFELDDRWPLVYKGEFLNCVVDYMRDKGYDFIIQPATNAIFDICPDNCISTPFGTYVIDLDIEADELWSNVSSKHRNRIRKAQKEGVRIERGVQYTDIAYDLMKNTMLRSNKTFQSHAKFKRLADSLGDNLEIFVALLDGQLQGCAAIPYSNYSAYCLYAGSIENLTNGAMNLLHWEAMQYFKSLGVKRYDFVGARISPKPGSRLEGIQAFKKKFGAEMKTGFLWKMPINQKKYNLFNLLLYVKDKGHCDIIDEERKRQHEQNNIDDVRLRNISQ
jgi:hypothetical protein